MSLSSAEGWWRFLDSQSLGSLVEVEMGGIPLTDIDLN